MKKVFQKLVCNVKGDCMQASIASLFEMGYDDVPKFIEYQNHFPPLWDLIHDKGFKYNGMLHNQIDKTNLIEEFSVSSLHNHKGIDGYFFASVYSPKYFDKEEFKNYGNSSTHAVIIDSNYNIVHDPNPNNQGIVSYPLAEELGYNGIINITLINKD